MVQTNFKKSKKRRNTKKTMRRQKDHMKGGDDLALFHKLTEDVRPPSESKILNRKKPLPKPSTNFIGKYNKSSPSKFKSHYSESK